MKPALSVIIPCYNQGQYLSDALEGVSDQDGIEVIIVNDGSTEQETIDIFKTLDRSKYIIIEQENKGLPATRNIAIQKASADYILALDADNKVMPEYYRKSIQILNENPSVGVVYCDPLFFGLRSGGAQLEEFNLNRLLYSNYIDACAVFRKEAWERAGGYDKNLPGYEDWELWISIYKKGWKFHHLNEFLFEYRVRENSMVTYCNLPEIRKKINDYVHAKHKGLYQEQQFNIQDYLETELSSLKEKEEVLKVELENQKVAFLKKIDLLNQEVVALHTKANSMRIKNRLKRLLGIH